jgi:hypothetical protein
MGIIQKVVPHPRTLLPSKTQLYPSPFQSINMASTLHGQALAASRAAISAAMADHPVDEDPSEPGEIQEVNMEAQAEGIRTVFSDPTNFNVKVGDYPSKPILVST